MQQLLETPAGPVPRVTTRWSRADLVGAARVRLGVRRDDYKIVPGLYAVGQPDEDAPVLVTANYKLSFDHLRRALRGRDAWILVADTHGINVWCAAAKGRFSAAEVALQVRRSGLDRVVRHRKLILPQLCAAGVAAHELRGRCGFRGVFGPICAVDLPEWLEQGRVHPSVRRVGFPLLDRAVLIPVDLVPSWRLSLVALGLALLLSGVTLPGGFSLHAAWARGALLCGAMALGLMAGSVGVPLLLPWLPGRAFSVKGATLGATLVLVIGAWIGLLDSGGGALASLLLSGTSGPPGAGFGAAAWLGAAGILLVVTAFASYTGMRFTGSTPFTSLSGVEREMRVSVPLQLGACGLGAILWVVAGVMA